MKRRLAGRVLALTCCLMQQGLVVAVAQEQQASVAAEQTRPAVTTKSGVADGARSPVWSPALTGVRHPLYRLCKSDVVAVHFTFSPEFDQIVSVQPDGYIALRGVKELPAEGATVPELQDAIGREYAGVLHQPEVSIVLQDFDKPYFVVAGEVNHQGKYELRSDDYMIASARFTILPSRAYETLGKTILESYAWGRPVIASDLGSRRELVDQGETGLLYPPGNVEQLGKAISFLAERPELAAQMGVAGRRFVEAQHAPEAHYRALMGLYTRMRPWPRKAKKTLGIPLAAPPLRVAFIGGRGMVSKYSGIETYYEEVGKRLVEMGHEVTVYCRSYFTPALPKYEGMRLVRLPTFRSKHTETFVHTLMSTIHVMFSGCDIVHYHAQGPALFSFFPRLVGKKTVVTVQGQDWQRKKWGRFASLTLHLGELASARLPNRTMVVSQTLQEHYRKAYGVHTRYVPNGSMIRERVAPSRILGWGLESDNYILFLGRLSPEKNCHLLIDAYEKLDTPAKLVLAGGSSYASAYVDQLRRHQSERVLFLDWVQGAALDELLTNAALFVLPSDLEGLSLALLDAMGAAVCVLTSDIPENREVIAGTGFTFQPGDATDLARMLRLLLSDARVRAVTGRIAQARVRERYLWPAIAAEIGNSYAELIERTGTVAAHPPSEATARVTSEQVG